MTTTEILEKNARETFTGHLNCAQSVLKTWLDDFGITGPEADQLMKSAIGLGGGLGHTGHVCGAVNGAVMALSLRLGYEGADDMEKKGPLYEKIAALISSVQDRYGTVNCDEIKEAAESMPEISGKNENDQDKCCVDVVSFCTIRVAELLDE